MRRDSEADLSLHVLGSNWKHASGTLVVFCRTDANKTVTQQVVLSLVSTVCGPIGPFAPYTAQARFLLKRLSDQQWGDNMTDEIGTKFKEWSK